jgi:pantoate--beta-alanine ligase
VERVLRRAGALEEGPLLQLHRTEAEAIAALQAAGFARIDYVEVRGADDLARFGPGPVEGPARVLAAAVLGRTRLIDNMAV